MTHAATFRQLCFAFICLAWCSVPLARAQTDLVNAGTNAAPDSSAAATTNAPVYLAPAQGAAPNPLSAITRPDAAQQDQLDDIRPPYFYLRSWFWLWLALALIAAIALLILLWILFKPRHQLTPKTAYDLTLEKLEKARALLREDQPIPYAVMVSEAIRTYLGQRFQSPSTRRTTEEFLRQMEADRTTPLAEHRALLREFLQSCDLVKFARYQPTLSELEQVQQNAYGFVVATKPESGPAHRNGK